MLENAEKHILLAKKTYESGAGTQLDLHDANVSLINAKIGYLKTKYDYLMTIARLSSIVGLGEDSLCKK
jgi:outer membrane protein TolC